MPPAPSAASISNVLPMVPIAMVRYGKREGVRSLAVSVLAEAVSEVCAVPRPLLGPASGAGSVVVAMSMMEITHRARVELRQQPVCVCPRLPNPSFVDHRPEARAAGLCR